MGHGGKKGMVQHAVHVAICLGIWLRGVALGAHAGDKAKLRGGGSERGLSQRSVTCRLIEVDIAAMDQRHGCVVKKCIPVVNGHESQIMFPLPLDLIDSYEVKGLHDYVSISDAYIEQGHGGESTRLVISETSTLFKIGERLLAQQVTREPMVGRHTALMVRVTSLDSTPSLSADRLRRRLFSDPVTPASVLRDCSFGQFRLAPASGANINGGVGEIEVGLRITGRKMTYEIEQAIITAARNKFGDISRFDFVLFCIPPGTLGDWSAYTGIGYFISYYNDEFGGILSAVVHELGHSLGLGHSGVGDNPYADQTGYMGYGYRTPGAPAQCFNGYKNYVLGWYLRREVVVDPREGAWGGRLSGFANYDETDDAVLLIVDDLYIQFNLAVRANRETQGKEDQVTITRSRDVSHYDSRRVASLSLLHDEYIFRAAGYQAAATIVIEVCKQDFSEGYAYLSIHLDTDESACRKPSERKFVSEAQCKDVTGGTFFVEELNYEMDCAWLRLQKRYTDELCESSHSSGARNICPSSCGLCEVEGCEDERIQRSESDKRKCILEKLEQQEKQEVPRKEEIEVISSHTRVIDSRAPRKQQPPAQRENSPAERLGGSAMQSQLTDGPTICDDAGGSFFVEETGKPQTCVWLRARPEFIRTLCEKGNTSAARDVCPETCGSCSDSCEDSETKFTIGNAVRNCLWLSLRPTMQEELCRPGFDAFELCGETCNVCD